MQSTNDVLPQVNDWTNVVKILNTAPNNFTVLQFRSGFFGSLVYRSIIGSSNDYVWNKDFCGCTEDLGPLEWPRLTEGFDIYELNYNNTYKWFKENHLATAHSSTKMIEYSTVNDILKYVDKNKILLLKTHNLKIHKQFKCKTIRITGKIPSITNLEIGESTFRKHHDEVLEVEQENLHNLNIENFMSNDFDIFVKEYLGMCSFLNIPCNINNVRQFILLLRDKLKRYKLTLP